VWYNITVTTLRAHFDGKVLIPVGPVDLPVGKELEVDVRETEGMRPQSGSAARLLEAMHRPPHLTAADVAELERAIEEGKLPVRYDSIFGEEE
jgi:hypothetical protein